MARGKRKPRTMNRRSMDGLPAHIVIWRVLRPVLIVVISLAIAAGVLYGVGMTLYKNYFLPVDETSTEQIEVQIKSGSSLTTISETLEEAGIIRNSTVFKYYVDFTDMSSKLLAGTYTLSPSMTFDDIVDVIKRPNEVAPVVRITLREGMTIEQMADSIIDQGVLMNKTEFLEIAKTGKGFEKDEFIAQVLKSDDVDKRLYVMEGYLFPDTYDFYTDATAETVIDKLLTQFNNVFGDSYKELAKELGMTADEVVTLASMIEKEARTDDFTKVSAVFHNRLEKNDLLGSDVTVQYAIKSDKLILTEEQLSVDSLYNTRRYPGLPLGPICNSSRAALKAALEPDREMLEDGYYYFILGDPATGEIVYTKTLEEHNKAVAEYRPLWEAYENGKKNDE